MKINKKWLIAALIGAVVAVAVVVSVAASGGNVDKFKNWQEAFTHLDNRVENLEVKHSVVCATLLDEYNAGNRRFSSDTKQQAHDRGIDHVQDYLDSANSGTHYATYWTRVGAESEYSRCLELTKPAVLLPTPTSAVSSCSADDYDRNAWGDYPGVPNGATAKWTLPSDNVNNTRLTHDHHVALKDAHVSGACNWNASEKDAFSSDLDNLNPTTGSFNSSKGSRTPDKLTGIALEIINTNSEKCAYATQHNAVKDEYGLSMTSSERATVNNWLALCRN